MTLWGNGTKTKPRVSSPYGPRKGGAFSFHYGTDFTGYTDLRAILGGTVTQVGRMNPQAGNVVVIDSKLADGRTVTIVRMHAASWTVKRGDHVAEGQVIGRMGSTGNASGPCDHVEIRFWDNGKLTRVDPEVWIAQQIAAPAPRPTPAAPAPVRKGTLQGLPWTGIQRMLKSDFGYTGRIDNIPGKGSISAFQRFMNAKGYGHLAVDGIDGVATLKAAQSWLKLRWGYTGAIDGIRGSGTTGAWGRAEAANGRAYARVR